MMDSNTTLSASHSSNHFSNYDNVTMEEEDVKILAKSYIMYKIGKYPFC